MGFDLSGHGGYFRWTNVTWYRLLEIAEEHGWQPGKTGAPRRTRKADWGGGYRSNNGQLFYARDAKTLALALEEFLRVCHAQKDSEQREPSDNADAWFRTTKGQTALREFIAYCRRGSFRLY